jgi:hypothetical protein
MDLGLSWKEEVINIKEKEFMETSSSTLILIKMKMRAQKVRIKRKRMDQHIRCRNMYK